MNKILLWVVGMIVVVFIGVMYVRNQQSVPNDAMMEKTDTMTQASGTPGAEYSMIKDDQVMEPTGIDAMMKKESRYVAYSKSAFDGAKGNRRVFFFHAPWCPSCVPADKEFQANKDKIPENVVLFKTDYDSSSELKKQYVVTYQHTYVQVDDTGAMVTKWNGGGIDELIANIK
ncbi:MAG: thioredoxin domain-containing protein [Pseudomonadota bacterium]